MILAEVITKMSNNWVGKNFRVSIQIEVMQ